MAGLKLNVDTYLLGYVDDRLLCVDNWLLCMDNRLLCVDNWLLGVDNRLLCVDRRRFSSILYGRVEVYTIIALYLALDLHVHVPVRSYDNDQHTYSTLL